MPPATRFFAYNRNGRVTQWRSRQVFPICRQMSFMNAMILIWKSAVTCWFWGWSPRGQMPDVAPIDPLAAMPAGEPWCPQGIHLKGSEASSGNSETCLPWSFSISCKFTRFIGIAQFGDLEESIHSEFAVGSRSLVLGRLSSNHAMEVYTDSKEAVAALSREADVGRPGKIGKSSQGQWISVAEGAVRKIKDAVAALRTSLREQGVDRLSQKKIASKNKIIVSLPRMQHLPHPNAVAVTAEDTAAKAPAAVWFYYVSLSILIIVLLVVVLLFCCWSSWGCHPKNLTELEMLWLSLRRMPPSFPFLHSLLPRTCCIRYHRLPIKHLLPFFLPSFLPPFLYSFLPCFLSSFLPSFLLSFIPCFLPSFLSGFVFLDAKWASFGASPLRHW